MTRLQQAISRAIPLVEAQTGAVFDVQHISLNRALIDITLDGDQYQTEHEFTYVEVARQDFDGLVYELLLTTVEAIGGDELGSVT